MNQNIQFNRSGYDATYDSWFTNLQINKSGGGVAMSSFLRVTNNFTVATATAVLHTVTTSLDVNGGRVITVAGSSLSGLNLLNLGDNVAFPAIAGAAAPLIRILGTITATGTITLPSSALEVRGGGVLNVSGADLTIAGSLATRDNGTLIQTAPGSHVLVVGDVAFFGGDEFSKLSAGVLEVRGNVSQGDGSAYRTLQTVGLT